jgi:site-specific recombinase XerD
MTTVLGSPTTTAFDPNEGSPPVRAVAVPVLPQSELDTLLERFLKSLVNAHHVSEMTATGYRWKLGHFFAWLRKQGVETIAGVTYAHFADYLTEVRWKSPRTSDKFACQCRKFARWCKARGALPSTTPGDFTGDYRAPKAPRAKPKSISREDLMRLLDGAATYGKQNGRMLPAVALAGLAGLRRNEITWVTWGCWDQEKKRLRIESPKTRRAGEASVRYVPASQRLAQILTENRHGRADTDTILDFPCFGGTNGNGNRALHGLCKQLKMKPIGWHALRHTAATLMVQAGVDIERVRAFLGHRDLTMTSIYVLSKDSDLDSAAEAIL